MKRYDYLRIGMMMIATAMGCAEGGDKPGGTGGFKNCATGTTRCMGNNVLKCNDDVWEDTGPCLGQTCTGEGICSGECAPDQKQCNGTTAQTCMDGKWTDSETCPFACGDGKCGGECVPDSLGCKGNMRQTCEASSFWKDIAECTDPGTYCVKGACEMPTSCVSLPANCGAAGNENCCLATTIPGGTYNRTNDPQFPATVSTYRLDRFEVTVGRFRKFVEAYPNSKPKPNAGAHPKMLGSGWDSAWDSKLAGTAAVLLSDLKCKPEATWTDAPGANELLPANCVDWYTAFAFCAWDGGRLPTESEWNHAAAAGDEQREFPWSNPPSDTTIDSTYAVYNCGGDGLPECSIADILPIASKSPTGDGKWGQSDLAGSMWEWTVDRYGPFMNPCVDCANLTGSDTYRTRRGGGWVIHEGLLLNSKRDNQAPFVRLADVGLRCARNP